MAMFERAVPWPPVRGATHGAAWPAIIDDNRAAILALAQSLEQTERLPAKAIHAGQAAQLGELAAHAAAQSTGFAARLRANGLRPHDLAEPGGLARLPPMTRRDLQDQGATLYCRAVPDAHGGVAEIRTSGSTGQPVVVRRTGLTQHFWAAFTLREHRWQRRDWSLPLAAIRPGAPFARHADWGAPVSLLFESGPAFTAPAAAPVADLARWLAAADPAYLIVYPSILRLLLGELARQDLRVPGLREIRTQGETLPPDLIGRAGEIGVRVTDNYSAEEVGVIALRCPSSSLYHIMAEELLVEILDDDDRPCRPGQAGRVVVTDLHNFATPLVRYDLGDHAEPGPACSCGRGLSTLANIRGRTRNMLITPAGRRWLTLDFHELRALPAIRQYQIVQRALHDFEIRLAMSDPLSAQEEEVLASSIKNWLQNDKAKMTFVYFRERIGAGSKFSEFSCEMPSG